MDIVSIAGIALSLVAIIGGNFLEGGHIGSLLQFTAFMIVFGGTVGAILLQTPMPVLMRCMKITGWIFLPPKIGLHEAIEKIVGFANIARREGLLGLESLAEEESDEFARKGLQLLVDGTEPDVIRGVLEIEMETKEHLDNAAAKVYEGMGGYAPTVGILGAVMGLIHVMENLSDPSKLGGGIAVAFVATIYGVGLANLFFLPMANKLKSVTQSQTKFREMIVEGMVSISQGENPRNIEMRLQSYLH
jgi:chemotaxis protein MotA